MRTVTDTDYKHVKQRCMTCMWLDKQSHHSVEEEPSLREEEGKLVKKLGRTHLGTGVFIHLGDDEKMSQETKEIMKDSAIIYGGRLLVDGVTARYDALVLNDGAWDVYLIKGTKQVNEIYYHELALQCYILNTLGYTVGRVHVMHLNTSYVRENTLNLDELFSICDVTPNVQQVEKTVKSEIEQIKLTLKRATEPHTSIGPYCLKAMGESVGAECKFKAQCFKGLPQPNIFDISGTYLKLDRKFELYAQGIISFEALVDVTPLSNHAKIQIDCELNHRDIIDKKKISTFLNTVSYPLYFLDFEAFNPSIPRFKGTTPYQQIAFQYSLHIKETVKSELRHIEYLAKEGINPTREFAEKLIKDLNSQGSIVVYNKGFETSIIKKLAEMYPDLNTQLHALNTRVIDLMDVFRGKFYYQKEMQGSYSIKNVLPALFPNHPELDYKQLKIKNGMMAMNIYPLLHLKSETEKEQIRNDLLAYCRLDTLAMVRILEHLEQSVV